MPDLWMDVDTALSEVPVNILPLIDDTDFKTIKDGIAYDAAGMDLTWNFVTTGGAFSSIAVTPTTGGDYDWAEHTADDGMYTIEIPASGGASANNDTEGFGWFTGVCTGVLPWRGPVIGFRDADLNNLLIDSAYSATRGLAGTALPAAVADAAGGLPISDAGGLDLDTKLANTNEVTAARMGALTDWINGGRLDLLLDAIKAITDQFAFTAANQVDANTLAISGSTDAADKLEASAETVVIAAAAAGTLSTTQMSTNLTEVTNDHYNGRIIIWTSGVLFAQATDITDYDGGTKILTYTAVTEAPSASDTFVIV